MPNLELTSPEFKMAATSDVSRLPSFDGTARKVSGYLGILDLFCSNKHPNYITVNKTTARYRSVLQITYCENVHTYSYLTSLVYVEEIIVLIIELHS